MACLRRLGLMASFGNASGMPEPYDIGRKGLEKSVFITRPLMNNYMTSDAIRQANARALFRMIKKAPIKIRIGQTYSLKDAPQAHRDAEARLTSGSTVLLP